MGDGSLMLGLSTAMSDLHTCHQAHGLKKIRRRADSKVLESL